MDCSAVGSQCLAVFDSTALRIKAAACHLHASPAVGALSQPPGLAHRHHCAAAKRWAHLGAEPVADGLPVCRWAPELALSTGSERVACWLAVGAAADALHLLCAVCPAAAADWLIEGNDIVAAIRTAYNGADSFHNSNRITFKRIQGYRQYIPASAATAAAAADAVEPAEARAAS